MDRKKTCNEGDHGFYERCRDYVHKLLWILNSNSLIRGSSFKDFLSLYSLQMKSPTV